LCDQGFTADMATELDLQSFNREQTQNCPSSKEKGQFCVPPQAGGTPGSR